MDSGIDFNDEIKESVSVCEDLDHKKFPEVAGDVETQQQIRRENTALKEQNQALWKQCIQKSKMVEYIKEQQEILQNERDETLTETGALLYRQAAEKNRKRDSEQFQKTFGTNKLMTKSTVQSVDTSLTTQHRSVCFVPRYYPTTSAPLSDTIFVNENLYHTEFLKDTGNSQTHLEIQRENKALKEQNKTLQLWLARFGNKICSMEEKLEYLKNDNNEILAYYGELLVKETAREKDKRNFEHFQQIFGTKQLVSTSKDERNKFE